MSLIRSRHCVKYLISWCGNFYGKARFPYSLRFRMWKLCLSTKFPHQDIRWNYGIFRSSRGFRKLKTHVLAVLFIWFLGKKALFKSFSVKTFEKISRKQLQWTPFCVQLQSKDSFMDWIKEIFIVEIALWFFFR